MKTKQQIEDFTKELNELLKKHDIMICPYNGTMGLTDNLDYEGLRIKQVVCDTRVRNHYIISTLLPDVPDIQDCIAEHKILHPEFKPLK